MSTGSLQSKRFEPSDEAGELVASTGRRTYTRRALTRPTAKGEEP